jgi:hypothetical protein
MAAVEKETEERKEELKVEQALKGEIDEKWAVSAEQQKRKKKEQAESAVAMEEELKLRLESVEQATDEMRHTLHTAEEERAHTEEREQHSLHQIAERNEHQQIELRRGEHRLQQLKHELEENNVVNDAKVDELKLMLMKRQKVAHQEVQQLVSFRQDLEIKLQKYAMFSKMKRTLACARAAARRSCTRRTTTGLAATTAPLSWTAPSTSAAARRTSLTKGASPRSTRSSAPSTRT